jgi:hypothetical protein
MEGSGPLPFSATASRNHHNAGSGYLIRLTEAYPPRECLDEEPIPTFPVILRGNATGISISSELHPMGAPVKTVKSRHTLKSTTVDTAAVDDNWNAQRFLPRAGQRVSGETSQAGQVLQSARLPMGTAVTVRVFKSQHQKSLLTPHPAAPAQPRGCQGPMPRVTSDRTS